MPPIVSPGYPPASPQFPRLVDEKKEVSSLEKPQPKLPNGSINYCW